MPQLERFDALVLGSGTGGHQCSNQPAERPVRRRHADRRLQPIEPPLRLAHRLHHSNFWLINQLMCRRSRLTLYA